MDGSSPGRQNLARPRPMPRLPGLGALRFTVRRRLPYVKSRKRLDPRTTLLTVT